MCHRHVVLIVASDRVISGLVADGDASLDAGVADDIAQASEEIWPYEQVGALDGWRQWLPVPVMDEVTAPLAAYETRAVVITEAEASDAAGWLESECGGDRDGGCEHVRRSTETHALVVWLRATAIGERDRWPGTGCEQLGGGIGVRCRGESLPRQSPQQPRGSTERQ
jgi:hypothetical protein